MFTRAQQILQQEMLQGSCYGYALAIGQKEKKLHQSFGGFLGGMGTAAVTLETRYDLASLTSMVATLPLTLLALEDGQLSLCDRLEHYFDVPDDKRKITLLHLLTHTSGMEANFLLEQEAENADDALRVLLRRPLIAQPGKEVVTSGTGMILMGKVLEKIYATTLDRAARQHIFIPLGMQRSGYLPHGKNIAHTDADTATGERRSGISNDSNTRFIHGISGSAGLFSCLEDCCSFLTMLSQEGRTSTGKTFLSQETTRLLPENHTRNLKEARGLCVFLPGGEKSFLGDLWLQGGYGYISSTGCSLAVEPKSGLYVVVLTNRLRAVKEIGLQMRTWRLLHNSIFADFLRHATGDAR